MTTDFIAYSKQKELIDAVLSKDTPFIIVAATGRQIGKDLRNDSILYYDGYTGSIGNCSIGDRIFDDNGELTTIIGKYPQGLKTQYRVTLADGRTINCGIGHLHQIVTNKGVEKTVDTQYIINNYLSSRGKPEMLYIKTAKSVQYSKKDHIIPPYVLGVLIAEGGLTDAAPQFTCGDIEVYEHIKSIIQYSITKRDINYYIVTDGVYNNELRRLNLNVKSEFKHIPDEYLFDSIDNRIELLRGLMDGDGTISTSGNMEYYTASDRLNIDFLNLVRSLGMKAHSRIKKTTFNYKGVKKTGLDCNRITIFSNDIIPFKLKRKADRFKSNPKFDHQWRTAIIDVKQIEDAESTCIEVNNNSHCFLTDNYTITHNTLSGIYIALQWVFDYPNETVLIVQPDGNYLNKLVLQFKKIIKPLEDAKICSLDKSKKIIEFSNGSIIDMQSALSEGAGRGTSASLIWFDEAAFVADDIFNENVMPTASVTGRKVLLTSTPFGQRGFFWNMYNNPENLAFRWASKDNPHLNIKFLRLMKKVTPKDSYEQEYKAIFLPDGGSVFDNIEVNSTITSWAEPIEKERYYAGIDWGNKVDSSVLTILNSKGDVVFIKNMGQTKYDYITDTFAEHLRYYNYAYCYAEENSIGEAVNDIFEKKYGNFKRVTITSSKSQDISTINNNDPLRIGKAKLITDLILTFNNNNIKIPKESFYKNLSYQLKMFTFKVSPGLNGYKYAAPAGSHDDEVISLAYANLCRLQNMNSGNIDTYKHIYEEDTGFW